MKDRNLYRLPLVPLFAVAALLLPADANANVTTCCGNNSSADALKWSLPAQTFKLLPISFSGCPLCNFAQGSFTNAANRWTDVAGSGFSWNVVFDDDNNFGSGDGNEVAFQNNSPNNFTVAITNVLFTGCSTSTDWLGNSSCNAGRIQEADIVFFSFFQNGAATMVQSDPFPLTNTLVAPPFFAVVASHEIGHAAGLAHTPHGMARMESSLPAGGWFQGTAAQDRVTPLPADASDLAFLYPDSTTGVDLYAINMQHTACTATFDADLNGQIDQNDCGNSTVLSDDTVGDVDFFPRNRVDRGNNRKNVVPGDIVDIRICVGNMGNQTWNQVVPLQILISQDSIIDAGDTLTADGWSFPAGAFPGRSIGCPTLSFTVPNLMTGPKNVAFLLATGTGSSNNGAMINQQINVL